MAGGEGAFGWDIDGCVYEDWREGKLVQSSVPGSRVISPYCLD